MDVYYICVKFRVKYIDSQATQKSENPCFYIVMNSAHTVHCFQNHQFVLFVQLTCQCII